MTPPPPPATRRSFWLLLCLLALPALQAGEIRDRITPEQMRQRQAGIKWQGGAAGDAPDPQVKSPANQSIIKLSVILSDGRFWTLVPKGSVLHLPERHRQRVVAQPTGQPISWSQFLSRNRSWLTTHNMDIPTAAGHKPIADKAQSFWVKNGIVVVAVYRGGAISVIRPEPEAQTAKS